MRPYNATPEQVERFHQERERFRLLYRCSDCVHVNADSQTCSLGFPNEELRLSEEFINKKGQFVFCKYFESD